MFYIISKDDCKWCDKAKELFRERGLPYREINLETNIFLFDLMSKVNLKTVPQIWKATTYIGGHDDLVKYLDH